MSYPAHAARAAALLMAGAVLAPLAAHAHGAVGKRFFPATMAIDDPLPADELGFTYSKTSPEAGDDENEIEGEYSKRLTDRLAVSIGKGWSHESHGDHVHEGFGNLETGLKYGLVRDAAHEFALSAGVDVEWGGAGDEEAGAENTTFVSPSVFFGKGFGDAPAPWLRPFAVTGSAAYNFPTRDHDGEEEVSESVSYGLSLQYSLPYFRQNVHDYGWGDFLGRLTPIVEAQFETPTARAGGAKTTGSVRPGVLWTGRKIQLGAEAILPINEESGDGVGFALQLHLYLDDIFPTSLGKPLFGGRP